MAPRLNQSKTRSLAAVQFFDEAAPNDARNFAAKVGSLYDLRPRV
jgi:hypothetical protein